MGYVTLDEGYALDKDVPKELLVNEEEVNCGGKKPKMKMEKMAVEFGIYKTKKGRAMLGQTVYQGVIQYYSWSGWGHIKPTPGQPLPIKVRQKMAETLADAKKKLKPGITPEEVLY